MYRYRDHTDGPESAEWVARSFAEAVGRAREAEAAVEIGVRAGGMSAIFCALAATLRSQPFTVVSVDPYGHHPYVERGRGRDVADRLDYGERHYAAARSLLAGFPNSMLFRLDADTFLDHLLPNLAWWHEHERYPRARRFLAFAYLDGRHDDASVLREAIAVLPVVAVGGSVVIDNINLCPAAAALLTALGNGIVASPLPLSRLVLTRTS